MNEQPGNAKQENFPPNLEIQEALISGKIRAISVDTCIFTNAGYQLEAGNFRQLIQLKDSEIKLIFSDITLGEVLTHFAKHGDEAKTKTTSALRSCGKFWRISKEKQNEVLTNLFGTTDSKKNASTQLNKFLKDCGAETVKAKGLLDIDCLLSMYFSTAAPFERAEEKKAEFPDAIALLTLEAWAKKNDTALLLVTKDKGCHRFCAKSDHLYSISDLGETLTLLQVRDKHLAELCGEIDNAIAAGKIHDFEDQLSSAVAANIWTIDWSVDADSAFYFDNDLEDIELVALYLTGENGDAGLNPVHFQPGVLVARATVIGAVKATADFSFSVKDGIDRDMVYMGATTAEATDEVEIDLLLTFEVGNAENPELVDVEIIPARRVVNFGNVEPNYEDDREEY